MLTRFQHQYALSLCDPIDRGIYRMHMCGVCHALGDGYGQLSRFLITREMIFLNLLVSAQQPQPPEPVIQRCPLNPLRQVNTNQDVASFFAAAVSIELSLASIIDDIQDSQKTDIFAQCSERLLRRPHYHAQNNLNTLALDSLDIFNLPLLQKTAERDSSIDPAGPTAHVTAQLFGASTQLAQCEQNAEILAAIGHQFGMFIYLLDAYHDFAEDMACGNFNPLAQFAHHSIHHVTLSDEGLQWLSEQFRWDLERIRNGLEHVQLYRYRSLITYMLCQPLRDVIGQIASHQQRQRSLTFRQLTLSDALKAALWIIPPALAGLALTGAYEPQYPDAEKQKRRRPSSENEPCRDWGDSCYYIDCDDCHCIGCNQDNNCCSQPNVGACDADHDGVIDCCDSDSGFMNCIHADCSHMDCHSLDCGDTNCGDVNCGDVDCGDIDCGDVDCSGMDFDCG